MKLDAETYSDLITSLEQSAYIFAELATLQSHARCAEDYLKAATNARNMSLLLCQRGPLGPWTVGELAAFHAALDHFAEYARERGWSG
ncbi:hypothetical protein GCM10007036_02920 [Alsobacter metallidurans]|uniref:Uncharacterized protein n=1 Tax=Alsobacter metallidurans TaxID=340221 RepID=A0A917MI05_9HYPH|nr:hypothetical protein GCM10007036_02920 [Alsobacter metallidurans]